MGHVIGARRAYAAAAVAAGLAAAACGAGTTSSSTGGSGASSAPTVTAQNIAFNPTTLTVPGNTQVTITFSNKDTVTHSLTFDDSSQSVQADGGQTQTLVFTSPASGATIAFHCKFHASMHGTISVGSGSGGGGAAPSSSSSSSSAGGGYGY